MALVFVLLPAIHSKRANGKDGFEAQTQAWVESSTAPKTSATVDKRGSVSRAEEGAVSGLKWWSEGLGEGDGMGVVSGNEARGNLAKSSCAQEMTRKRRLLLLSKQPVMSQYAVRRTA